jgi:two-component system, cell cycle sensor histidine kinase and response regulator CckA
MPTVLVVDDEPLIRQVVALMLQQDGYSVLTAGGGLEALSVSRSHGGTIDLLVSDVVMPGMDGPTLAAELLEEHPQLSVLFISASREAAKIGGCPKCPLLAKPFSMSTLRSAVQGLVPAGVWAGVG